MDEKDQRILYWLSRNARIPLKKLAKKLRLSPSTVSYRIDKLFDDDILVNLHPIIDNAKLGYKGFRAYFSFTATKPEEEQEIFAWLEEQQEVSVLAECTGSIDGVIMSWVKDRHTFYSFIKRLKEQYRGKIRDLEVYTYMKAHHFNRDYLVEDQDTEIITIGEGDAVEYDELDMDILKSLLTDARKPSLQMGQDLDVTAKTVARRMKQMEKTGVIAGYGANINLEKLDYEYYKLNVITASDMDYQRLLGFARGLDNSVYVDETLGKYDFELNVEVAEVGLSQIIDKLKSLCSGIRTMTQFQIERYHTLRYLGDATDAQTG